MFGGWSAPERSSGDPGLGLTFPFVYRLSACRCRVSGSRFRFPDSTSLKAARVYVSDGRDAKPETFLTSNLGFQNSDRDGDHPTNQKQISAGFGFGISSVTSSTSTSGFQIQFVRVKHEFQGSVFGVRGVLSRVSGFGFDISTVKC